ncbi:hypothetical protein LUZ60_004298 [Juncus effusus]|nr:hypothetical protein LUZ60_004298 [Juncus effusus]
MEGISDISRDCKGEQDIFCSWQGHLLYFLCSLPILLFLLLSSSHLSKNPEPKPISSTEKEMQQSMQMAAAMPAVPPGNITTEQIQKYLDENKQLILAILENQNLGKLSECAQYQAQLQKNLLYLAAIADAQPQSPSVRPQTPGTMTPGGMPPGSLPAGMTPQAAAQYMQQSQMFSQRNPLQMHQDSMQQTPPPAQHGMAPSQHGMPFVSQMAMRPAGGMNGMAGTDQGGTEKERSLSAGENNNEGEK